ncbi:MAG TPA: hypothetical protein EYP46_02285 [Hadesarchaea archaeon]|nr:hypothetical protein [Hadesarchaea archaeon]
MSEKGITSLFAVAVAVVVIVTAGVGYFLLVAPTVPGGGPSGGQPGGAEEMGIPIYSGAAWFSVPNDMKSGFGIPSDLPCDGYTTSASPEDVVGWYKDQMGGWELMTESSTSPPDQPGLTIYMLHYKKGENGAFIFTMSDPHIGETVLGIVSGPWLAVQGCGGQAGDGEPQEEGQPGENDAQFPELGTGPVTFSMCPMDLNDFTAAEPLGRLNPRSGHTFPSDHGGFVFKNPELYPPPYDVRAPAGGIISSIDYYLYDWPEESGFSGQYTDYTVTIHHTNTFYSKIGHISELDESILEQADGLTPGTYTPTNIPISAGDVIGKAGGRPGALTGLDWWVVDEDVTLTGFIHPENYPERTTHIVHFIDYCEDNLRTILADRLYNSVTGVKRTAEPLGGKIDFDQLGKLVGNWIHESTTDPSMEWTKHLAFVYDLYDPTQIRIAVGDTAGEFLDLPGDGKIYQVVGNSPDPADISMESGMVVYRLRGTPEWGDESVTATIIVQLVDDERIKVEGFSGHPSNPQFTADAQYYVR